MGKSDDQNPELELYSNKIPTTVTVKANPTLLLYSNINNLRHFGSLDAIVSRSCFQTSIFDESLGSLVSSSLLLTPHRLARQSLEEFRQDVNPVAVEFDLSNTERLSGFLVGLDYTVKTMSGRIPADHDFLFVALPGSIPMSVVKRILFRSTAEMRDFNALRFKGIEFDQSKFAVDPETFAGDFLPDIGRIRQLAGSINQDVPTSIQKAVWQRDRNRGSLLAASGGLELNHSESVIVSFDKDILRLLARLKGDTGYDFQEECSRLGTRLDESLVSMGLLLDFDISGLPRDPTPFPYWDDCVKTSESKLTANSMVGTAANVAIEPLCDRIAYEDMLRGLRGEDASKFRPVEFLDSFLERFIDAAPHRLPEQATAEFDRIRKKYQDGVGLVKRVVGQYEKASDVLRNWQGRFYSLKAFMTFATTYSPDSYGDLENRLGKYLLTPFEKRLVWSMYGMLNGMGPLGEGLKQRQDLLLLTDLLVQSQATGVQLSDFSAELEGTLDALQKEPIKQLALFGSPEPTQVTLWSKIGMALSFKVTDVAEPVRLAVLKQLARLDEKERTTEAILDGISVPDRFICYVTELSEREIAIEFSGRGVRIRHKKRAVESRRVWENWDLYVAEFLNRRDLFAGQSKEQLEVWKRILRGEPVAEKSLPKPKRKAASRRKSAKKG